ncbi:MAG: hypothetical protein RL885_22770 [Planctomycetota bacterium]
MLGFHVFYFLVISLIACLVFSAMNRNDVPGIVLLGLKRFAVFTSLTALFGAICWGLMEVF